MSLVINNYCLNMCSRFWKSNVGSSLLFLLCSSHTQTGDMIHLDTALQLEQQRLCSSYISAVRSGTTVPEAHVLVGFGLRVAVFDKAREVIGTRSPKFLVVDASVGIGQARAFAARTAALVLALRRLVLAPASASLVAAAAASSL